MAKKISMQRVGLLCLHLLHELIFWKFRSTCEAWHQKKTQAREGKQDVKQPTSLTQLIGFYRPGWSSFSFQQKKGCSVSHFPADFSLSQMQALDSFHFLILAEGRVQYLRHFWRSSQEAHVQSAPEIGPCDAAGWLARGGIYILL